MATAAARPQKIYGHQISGKKYVRNLGIAFSPPNYMTITGDILIYSPYILWPQIGF